MTHLGKKSRTHGSASPLFTETYISLYIFFWESLFFSGKTFPGPRMVPSVKCSELLIVFTGPLSSLCFRQFFLLFLSSLSTPLPFFQSSWSLFPQLSFSLPSSVPPFFFFMHPFYSWVPTSSAVAIPLVFIFLEAGRVLPRTSATALYALENWVGFLEVWKRLPGCSDDWYIWVSSKFPLLYYLLTCFCDSQVTNPSEFIVILEHCVGCTRLRAHSKNSRKCSF